MRTRARVSVLFSEPKIPQFNGFFLGRAWRAWRFQCSSASRKFLNQNPDAHAVVQTHQFQCSSASRKFLNPFPAPPAAHSTSVSVLFSEPKIPQFGWSVGGRAGCVGFQCSSASRKFLNHAGCGGAGGSLVAFQCSSASRKFLNHAGGHVDLQSVCVSVLFSEPKIPQSSGRLMTKLSNTVSVLFSEPKIPQSTPIKVCTTSTCRFSALQRAENSSIVVGSGGLYSYY